MTAPRQGRESLFYDLVLEMLQRTKNRRLPEQDLIDAGAAVLRVGKPTVKGYLDIMLYTPGNPIVKDGHTVILNHVPHPRPERYRLGVVLPRAVSIPERGRRPHAQTALDLYA